MKDSIANRVRRIIAGGVNSMISSLEMTAPAMVMEQAVAEVEEAIDEVRVELGKELASKHLIAKRIAEESRKHEEIGAQIELALTKGEERLAEAGVARQLDIEAQIPVLEQSLADCGARESELESFIHALSAKKRELIEELNNFKEAVRDREVIVETNGGIKQLSGTAKASAASKANRAVSLFERIYEQGTGVVAPGSQLNGSDAAHLRELERLARKEKVGARLNEIKARLAVSQ